MQVKKQQLEPNMEQRTGSQLVREYVKAVYCHPAYLTYMQSMYMLSPFSRVLLFVTPWTSLPISSVRGDSAGKNTGVGFHGLLQGIFWIQGLNPSLRQLLHYRRILYHYA